MSSRLRKECVAGLFLAVVFMMACAHSSSVDSSAKMAKVTKFVYDKGPSFSVTYPSVWKEAAENPNKAVFRTHAPNRIPIMEIGVGDPPAGVALADVNVKFYKGELERTQETDAKIKEEKQVTLGDGIPAEMALISWKYNGAFPMVTRIVSAYKDGKWVFVAVHDKYDDNPEVPQSLKFQ